MEFIIAFKISSSYLHYIVYLLLFFTFDYGYICDLWNWVLLKINLITNLLELELYNM